MYYTVGETAKRLGVAPSTLRYYDKEGLLPFVERSEGGIRLFKEADFEWLRIIDCLKKTGMQLKDIKSFVEMAMEGDATVEPRLALIVKRKEAVLSQLAELNGILRILEFKEWYYGTALEKGSVEAVKNIPIAELPKQIQETLAELKGSDVGGNA